MLTSFSPYVEAELAYRRERIIATFRRGERHHAGHVSRALPPWRIRHDGE